MANAQGQELATPHKKWLVCNIDWIFTMTSKGVEPAAGLPV